MCNNHDPCNSLTDLDAQNKKAFLTQEGFFGDYVRK